MTRDNAYEILTKYVTDEKLLKHSLATEAAMRQLANYFGEDIELWGITGLLHDADYQLVKGNPQKHGKLLIKKEPNKIPSEVEQAIKAHNYEWTKVMPKTRMEWAITCCDELTAIIVAVTNTYPSKKLESVSLDYLMNRLRSREYLKNADRKNIFLCEEKLGIPLIEFVTMVLLAMKSISAQIGL